MHEDEFDDEEFEAHSREIQEKLKEISRKEFVDGCYMAYDMLVSKGDSAIVDVDLDSVCKAIDRMTSLFIINEEYERCQFLADYVKRNIPGHEINPDPSVKIEMGY